MQDLVALLPSVFIRTPNAATRTIALIKHERLSLGMHVGLRPRSRAPFVSQGFAMSMDHPLNLYTVNAFPQP